jgi:hypothetical protein
LHFNDYVFHHLEELDFLHQYNPDNLYDP